MPARSAVAGRTRLKGRVFVDPDTLWLVIAVLQVPELGPGCDDHDEREQNEYEDA